MRIPFTTRFVPLLVGAVALFGGTTIAMAQNTRAAAPAAATARVEQVQFPAWLERGGLAVPLTAGLQLQPKDRVITGGNARAYLIMGEGSLVKLGENAKFEIEEAGRRRGVFAASLNVLQGAFRFTTSQAAKLNRRDVTIRVANVTAGIRGTDLWGKSTQDRDIVCLIEGDIEVKADLGEPVRMNQPLQFFQKPRGLAPLPVGKVELEQLKRWGAETEIVAGTGTAGASGVWRVEAGSFTQRDGALALARQLRQQGYPAEMTDGTGAFVVQVTGLIGEAEAQALAKNLANIAGTQPRVAR
jgi:hypothetical protein